jgi:hypothetical protein
MACVKVEHYESSTLSRSEYDYSVGSSSWKSHNIEKVHSLVEVFNKKHVIDDSKSLGGGGLCH